MNWYKQAQHDMYGQPLDFKEQMEAPLYQGLLDNSKMEWYSPKAEDYVKGPTKDYMAEMKNMKGDLVYMSPDEYINECVTGAQQGYFSDGLSKPFDELKKEMIQWRRMSTTEEGGSLIEQYKDRWVKGEQPSMGYIIYHDGEYFGQEGLHRALMAKDLGVQTIPVLIINKGSQKWIGIK